jgi:hypothetical protein
MITSSPLLVFGACLALFLVGVNTAFLMNLGNALTRWFTFKILSVDLLMIYVSLSLALGTPATWRALIGICAMLVDIFALGWMWAGISKLKRAGVTGLIPLGKLPESPGGPQGVQGIQGERGLQGRPGRDLR